MLIAVLACNTFTIHDSTAASLLAIGGSIYKMKDNVELYDSNFYKRHKSNAANETASELKMIDDNTSDCSTDSFAASDRTSVSSRQSTDGGGRTNTDTVKRGQRIAGSARKPLGDSRWF